MKSAARDPDASGLPTAGVRRVLSGPRVSRVLIFSMAALWVVLIGGTGWHRAIANVFMHRVLCQKWSRPWAMTLNARRDGLEATRRIEAHLGLTPGMRVCDLGAGAGYWTFKMATAVGPSGRVLATDVDRDMLAHIEAEARRRGIRNVQTHLVGEAEPRLEPGGWDRVLMVNVYTFWQGRDGDVFDYLRRVRAAMRPGAVLVFFRDEPLTCEHPARYRLAACESVRVEVLASLAARAGLRLKTMETPALGPAGRSDETGLLLVFTAAESTTDALRLTATLDAQ